MNKFFSLFLSIGVALSAQAQVVLTIEGEDVSQKEFLSIYAKNNPNPDVSDAALDEYMELFINYKLKVLEAKERGMDTVPSFLNELKGYRRQLAKPYLTDTLFESEMLEHAYDRMNHEVRANHILLKIDSDAEPADTLKIYNRLMSFKKRIDNGESFSKLASSYSEDPSAKSNGGDLGFFAGMQMVFPFEEAAFTTEIGKTSLPVRTRFGYHLIQVTDKRDAIGKVNASHILIALPQKASDELTQEAKQKIDAIYKRLVDGESFEDLATKFSEDKSSAKQGGNLGEFGTGKMVETFENQVFSLDSGEYSQPFLTPYGYHIVKVNKRIPVETFEEAKPEILKRLASDGRAKQAKVSLVNKLKVEYNYTQNDKALAEVVKAVNGDIFKGTWKLPKGKWDKTIAEWKDNTISQRDFALYLQDVQRETFVQEKDPYIYRIFDVMVSKAIYDFEDERLEEKYPNFDNLMKEYHDGILLFDLTNKEVWSKAVNDSAGLSNFFKTHAADYQWKDRANVVVAKSESADALKMVKKMLKKGDSISHIDSTLNVANKLNLRIEEKLIEKSAKEGLDASSFSWKKGKFSNVATDNDNVLIYVKSIEPARAKTMDEIRGQVISDYQNELERMWLKELRAKYNYEVHTDILHSIK